MPDDLRVWTGTPVVIDASAGFKWFDTHEPSADVAADLLEEHSAGRVALLAPEHFLLEVTHVLGRRRVTDEVTRCVDTLLGFDVLIVPLERDLLIESATIAAQRGLPVYDAAYVALAELVDAVLVTADRTQARAAKCAVRLLR